MKLCTLHNAIVGLFSFNKLYVEKRLNGNFRLGLLRKRNKTSKLVAEVERHSDPSMFSPSMFSSSIGEKMTRFISMLLVHSRVFTFSEKYLKSQSAAVTVAAAVGPVVTELTPIKSDEDEQCHL